MARDGSRSRDDFDTLNGEDQFFHRDVAAAFHRRGSIPLTTESIVPLSETPVSLLALTS
jgi:hypothetical protein